MLNALRLCFVALLLGLSACASNEQKDIGDQPVEKLYADARGAFAEGEFKKAAALYDEVERQHPYSQWATHAKLMSAYASYQAQDYDTALSTLNEFIDLHPGHPDVAYAYYLKAICYYEQIVDVGRDQDLTRKATDALNEVIRRFPDTAYARDAAFKKGLTQDHLAGKEMEIGRFYIKRGFYQAAINRFKIVIEKYQTTTHTPEALHRLVESYMALGLRGEAQKMAAVLGHNYPNSEWYRASYNLMTKGETLQLERRDRKEATTTAGKLKNTFMDLFD